MNHGDGIITIEDVLSAIIGQHSPNADTALDDKALENTEVLAIIARFVASELSLNGRLSDYFLDNYPYASGRTVAQKHEDIIMHILEFFEPQVEKYYKEYLAMPERTCENIDPGESQGYFTCSVCRVESSTDYRSGGYDIPSFCPSCGAKVVQDD